MSVAVVAGSYTLGARNNQKNTIIEEQKEFIDTTRRIDNAPVSTTRDDAIERLRDMGDLR